MTNQIFRFIISVFILLMTISCNNSQREYKNIDLIKVYYIPENIMSPVNSDSKGLRKLTPKIIKDHNTINKVASMINNLSYIENDYGNGDIYLLCDLYIKDKKISLTYDRFKIKIDNKVFKTNDTLISLLRNGNIGSR